MHPTTNRLHSWRNEIKIASAAIVFLLAAFPALVQNVKITPVGSHPGELCANDRAIVFEDPTGGRFLYDPAHNVTGGDDPRLGTIHIVLLTHMHGDHVGDLKLKAPGAGTCANSELVPAPNSTTAEVVAAKNAAMVLTRDIGGFVSNKVLGIRGGKPIGLWVQFVFAFAGIVLVQFIAVLGVAVRFIKSAFDQVPPRYEMVACTLGASPARACFTICLPLARRGLLASGVLAWAKALGEFGATIVVAGSIPGQTTTLSVAIYQAVQVGDDAFAYGLAGFSALLAFCAVLASEMIFARRRK